MSMISITIHGRAQTAGSKRAFPFKRATGQLGVRVTHDNPKTTSWMYEVRSAAARAYNGPLIESPVEMTVDFYFCRPKGHIGKRGVKPGAPDRHTVKPDLCKLVRCIEDALTGVVWRDDSQVFRTLSCKQYGDTDFALITIYPHDDTKRNRTEQSTSVGGRSQSVAT